METSLYNAYLETTYQISQGSLPISLKIGHKNGRFKKWCEEKKVLSWAIITAYNPYSMLCSNVENENRQQILKTYLVQNKLCSINALGVPADANWEAEKSLFIYNLTIDKAKQIGKLFEQNAIVYGNILTPPRLCVLVT
ncbi:DUF3293 domain-containing protein [Aquimarina sp. TRL1]|uniref:DUF3293 domain-containing protein n=1 Tax=Aquimarina sp. (strain TRL1) TaxID=2736252 RepID=UPI00158AEF03|nr:DUF3293 domain-containing protein [Aquimarina sp. TRL1]QKX06434.1 DUF3293 domain-containing protein [Aquimarina sp. TRL1]